MTSLPWSSLAQKTIWVTGGAGYFGGAITRALDLLCEKVICIDLEERAQNHVDHHQLQRTIPVAQDLTDCDAMPGILDQLMSSHGVPDGVVHLSYASLGSEIAFTELPAAVFAATVENNLVPSFVLSRHVAERMKPRNAGSVILFSSMYGIVSPDPRIYQPPMLPNSIDYGASKAAVIQMTRYFAVHYGRHAIRFNCISPGPFPHLSLQASEPEFIQRLGAKTALGRIGNAEEMIGPSLFLLTDSASYITGHNLQVDGGWTAC